MPAGPPPGLVASYGFDEGSGTTTADQSGGGNNGTLANTTWSTAGRYGKALSLQRHERDGDDRRLERARPDERHDDRGLGAARPSRNDWQTLIVKERPGDLVYGLYASTDANRPQSQVTLAGTARAAERPRPDPRRLVDPHRGDVRRDHPAAVRQRQPGVARSPRPGRSTPPTSPVRIGGNTIWSEWFNGLIDEVRIYNRALSAAEIQTDMNTAISAPDAQAPGAPGHAHARPAGLGQVSLGWGAATDNVGVARYNVHRGTSAGFTPSAANRIAQPTGDDVRRLRADARARTGTASPPRTRPANVGPASNEASAAATADTTAPTPPTTLTATPAPARSRSPGAARPTPAGSPATTSTARPSPASRPAAANRIAQPTGTSHVDPGLTGGTYYYRVTAVDPAGNESTPVAPGKRRRPDRAARRARRRVGLRRRRRHDGGGQLRQRQRRHDQRPDLDDGRALRQRAHLRRRQRPRHRRRREQPRLHDRHDARGVGPADRARQRLADGADEGATVEHLLCPLRGRERRDQGPGGRDLHEHVPARRRERRAGRSTRGRTSQRRTTARR